MTNAGHGDIDYLEETWDDLRIVPGAFQFAGSSDPTLSAWQPTGAGATFQVYEFTNADEVFFSIQMPHKYVQGSDLKPHIHWTPRARGVAESGKTVAWKLDYTIADVDENFIASATVDLTDTCSGVNEKHEITVSETIVGTNLLISHMIIGRIYRDAGDSWATNTPGNRPVLLEFDIHYQLDTIGSQNEVSKVNK